MKGNNNTTWWNISVLIGIFLLLAGAVYLFSHIVAYFVVAFIVSAVLQIPTRYIESIHIRTYKVPRLLAVLLSYLLIILVVVVFIFLFVPLITKEINIIASIKYTTWINNIIYPIDLFEYYLIEHSIIAENHKGFIIENIRTNLLNLFNQAYVTQLINTIIAFTSNFFVGFASVFFISFILLYENDLIKRNLIALVPNQYFEVFIAAAHKVEKSLSNYLIALFFQMLWVFFVASVGLLFLRVEYALTIALFAAIANLVPYLGPFIGGSFGLLVGLSTAQNLVFVQDYAFFIFKILLVFWTVQFTDNMLMQPIIFSKSVKAHPLEIFVIVFVGATIGGAWGMVAAIPLYSIVRVCVAEFYKGYKGYRIFRNHKI